MVSLGGGSTTGCLLPLTSFLKKEQPDILIANLSHNNIAAVWAAALARSRTRIIVSQHGSLSSEKLFHGARTHWVLHWLYRLFIGWADGIVVVSEGIAEDLVQSIAFDRRRITVIHNPVVFHDFNEKLSEEPCHLWLAGEKDVHVILGARRLVRNKRIFETLLAAFALAASRNAICA